MRQKIIYLKFFFFFESQKNLQQLQQATFKTLKYNKPCFETAYQSENIKQKYILRSKLLPMPVRDRQGTTVTSDHGKLSLT